jgi:hypothetical protein
MGSWSGLRKTIREKFVRPLKKRLDLHYTVYESIDRDGFKVRRHWSFWITLDRTELIRVGCCGPLLLLPGSDHAAENTFGPDEAVQSLKQYLNLSIDDAISSDNVLIRALAFVDERLGKRRLLKVAPKEDEHELIKLFYKLRLEAEAA